MLYNEIIQKRYVEIAPYIRKTPLLTSSYFSQLCNAQIQFKCENLQYTNSFKVRGAVNKVLSLTDKSKILITASGGNHGLGLCYAGKQFGMKTEVILPKNTPSEKIEKIKTLGGTVSLYGDVWDDANEAALNKAKNQDYIYVHPFSDDEVIAGQATIALEILTDAPDTQVIITSIGGGGLISGISQYAKSVSSSIQVFGVETIGADSMYQSLKADKIVELPAITSVVESLAARKVTEKTFGIVKKYVNDVVRVSDKQALKEVVSILQEEKLLVEPASSCTVAAILAGQLPDIKGKKVAVVLCGGNFSLSQLKQLL